jgi:phosphatidylserine/phosphatidylglycerophosphate/cardiolipin synthase-like enzyme
VLEGSPAAEQDGDAVYFSPHGGCEAAVVKHIHGAQKTIDMQAYSFTSMNITLALEDAQARGVRVRAILDKTQTGESGAKGGDLSEHNILTFTDDKHPIAHNKVIILDGQTVITGSYNYTKQAENANAENLVIISGKPIIAAAYERNFEEHLGHSQPYDAATIPQRERSR